MIFRIFPTKDTFLTNFRRQNIPQTGSNFGASEILHLFSVAPTTSSAGYASGSVGRILSRFDVSQFCSVTGSTTSSISYRLRMANAGHSKTLPSSYDIEVLHVSGNDWDEGRGRDVDAFFDKGYCNWDKARSSVLWANPGGDSYSSPVSLAHIDEGHEDLSFDVTDHVNSWLTGTHQNLGFMVRLSSSLEYSSLDYYVKMLHSRETHFPDRVPYLEASWNDVSQTGTVTFASDDGPYFANVTNLKNEYRVTERTRLRLFVRKRDFNPAVVLTSSLGPAGLVVDRAYYQIENDRTKEVIVPFGTGSLQSTRLSYDSSGSYFNFHMSTLPRDNVYRLVFLFDVTNQSQLIDQDFKFRVV